MKKYFYALGIVIVVIFGVTNFAFALIDCPEGHHTFSGDTQASSRDMCIPDVGPSGPVSGSKTFTPSTKGTIAPSGTTSQTQSQGIAIDTQVNSEVNRLYGTSIYAQAKALYDASVSANNNDFNSVSNQVKNLDYDTADALKRAYNIRAIERLNQVWNGIIALETTYAQQQKQQAATPPAITPTPISPTPINPTPINPTVISPTPINPTTISPTPINPTGISPTEINPTPINPTPVVAQYYDASNFTSGQTINAPVDQPANIARPDQNIYMQAGSIIKFVSQNTWQTVNGIFRFLEKTAINGRYKVRTNGGATVSVRGTQFIINETPNVTTITLIKGALSVAPAKKGKPAVNLKEGYQLVITCGVLGKPAKFAADMLDTSWYENISAGQNFWDSSWTKEAAANRYRRECIFTAAAATPTVTPTSDEQKIIDAINQGILAYRAKTSDLVMEKDKKLSSAKERTNVDGTVAMQLYFDSKGIYYPGDKAGSWKTFQDKNITNKLFKIIREENLTYDFDQSTFTFTNWEGAGKNRLAVYSGQLTSAGTGDVIGSATGQSQESGQPVGIAKIYLDEESQLWNKTEITINVQSGKVVLPLYQNCQITYGDAVKVALPSKAKKVDAKTGSAEFSKAIRSVQ